MTAGFVKFESRHAPAETMNRLIRAVEGRNLTVFLRLDHAAGAARAGLNLGPTELVVFGRAEGGTPLMQANPEIGVDLPLRALVWRDAQARTWVGFDDPRWLAERHGLAGENEKRVAERLFELVRGCALLAARPETGGDGSAPPSNGGQTGAGR